MRRRVSAATSYTVMRTDRKLNRPMLTLTYLGSSFRSARTSPTVPIVCTSGSRISYPA